MSNTTTLDLIERINDLRSQELEIKAAIDAAVADRKALSRQRDIDRREQSEQSLAEAIKIQNLREQELSIAESAQFSLEDRLDRGDDSVSAEDLTFAEKTLDRAKRLLAAAKASRQESERQAKIDRSDSMLGTTLADIIEANLDTLGLAGFDIDVRTRPGKQTPPTGRQIAVCQQDDTDNVGSLEPTGTVKLLVYAPAGDLPEIDTIALAKLFGEKDTMRAAEVQTPEPLDDADYVRQMYVLKGSLAPEIPHLFGGSAAELNMWINFGIDIWCDRVANTRYPDGSLLQRKGTVGRAEIISSSIEDDPSTGTITSHVMLTLVTEEHLDVRAVRNRVSSDLGDLWLGDHTLIGKINAIEVASVEVTRVPYTGIRERVMTLEAYDDSYEEAYAVELTITGQYVPLDGAQ